MSTVVRDRNAALLDWYRRRGRSLPWRQDTDPYRILVSEVMLQQTQVDRVVPRFERFMERFPTVETLAAAPLAAVLAEWSGLGYNRRAQWLRDAAAAVVAEGWPRSADALRRLPGVGPYTAAAVASIAFGERVAAVDTNLHRVLDRWHGRHLQGAELREAAAACVADDAGAWNQAMMDLGATRCRPRDPDCGTCPVAAWCAGPDVDRPVRRQARFEGSRRQRRGAVVRAVVSGEASVAAISRLLDLPAGEVAEVVADLASEGLLVNDGDRVEPAP